MHRTKYFIILVFSLFSCTPQIELLGNYENKLSIPLYEKPIFFVRGIDTLEFHYNYKFYRDSTYTVYNCQCQSNGYFKIKNDSIFLFNQSVRNDSIPNCFENNSYQIKNQGKKLFRRKGNVVERLYKQS